MLPLFLAFTSDFAAAGVESFSTDVAQSGVADKMRVSAEVKNVVTGLEILFVFILSENSILLIKVSVFLSNRQTSWPDS